MRLCDLTASIKGYYHVGNVNPLSSCFVVEYELVEVRRLPVPQYLQERKEIAEQRKKEREEYKSKNVTSI
jgi:hypothetical protein